MNNNRRVKHGTPIHSQPALCRSCRHATFIKGQADSEEYTYCDEVYHNDHLISIHVTECSKFDDRRHPPLGMMQQIAWKIATDKSGKKIGFMSPDQFRRAADKDEIENDHRAVYNPLTGEESW